MGRRGREATPSQGNHNGGHRRSWADAGGRELLRHAEDEVETAARVADIWSQQVQETTTAAEEAARVAEIWCQQVHAFYNSFA